MNREREKENDDSIVVPSVVVVATTTGGGAPIADIQAMALSLPDQLRVLLQGQPIAAQPF